MSDTPFFLWQLPAPGKRGLLARAPDGGFTYGDFAQRMGVSRKHDPEDVEARRHVVFRSVDTPLPELLFRCACPGPFPDYARDKHHRCIQRATQEDRMCDTCRDACKIAVNTDGPPSDIRSMISWFGPAEGYAIMERRLKDKDEALG